MRPRDFLLRATGIDSDRLVNEVLIRFCAAFLDQGVADWPLPGREHGFFRSFAALYRDSHPVPRWLRRLPRELKRIDELRLSPLDVIDESLRRLRTDHLDVWQVHEVVYHNDPDLIFAPNGAAEALVLAKEQGKVRFVGFTGHKDPSIHRAMLAHGFPFDTVQMPLNCLDGSFRSFERDVLPEATRQGLAVLGMKSMGGSGEIVKYGAATPAEALRYAMSVPGIATTISGNESVDVLQQNLAIAGGFTPMTAGEMQSLRERCRPLAADGRYELFKTTKKYDGDLGRQQHHFPVAADLPL